MSGVKEQHCLEFQGHQWKKDTCVNCSKPQRLHAAQPVPSTRRSVPRTKPPASATSPINDKGKANLGSAHEAKLAFLQDSPNGKKVPSATQNGSRKPDEKQVVAGKVPSETNHKVKKQASFEEVKKDQGKQKIAARYTAAELTTRSISVDCSSPSVKSDVALARSQSNREEGAKRRPDGASKRVKNRMSRPAGPPPQAPVSPDANKTKSTESLDMPINLENVPKELLEDIKKQLNIEDNSHYYHKYDVSASLRRKQPAIVDIETRLATATPEHRNALIAKIKETIGPNALEDSLPNDITPDQIAMPYNIVDVSSNLPNDDRPPQLPVTPNPTSQDSLDRASLARKQKLKKEIQENGTSQTVQPYNWHTYEPISDPNGNGEKDIPFIDETPQIKGKEAFVRASPVRSTAPARGPLATSWKPHKAQLPIDDKVTAMAHVDLNPPPTDEQKASPTKLSPPESSSTTSSTSEGQTPPAVKKSSNKSKEKLKKEKERTGSSGGGGFFKKLFGFGRRDSTQDNTSENGSSHGAENAEPDASSESAEEDRNDVFSVANADISSNHVSDEKVEVENGKQLNESYVSEMSTSMCASVSSEPKSSERDLHESCDTDPSDITEDKLPSFVSFEEEMTEMIKNNKLNLDIATSPPSDKSLIGTTSLTDEILGMLNNFGTNDKKEKPSLSPKPVPSSNSKPGLPPNKPSSRQKPEKPLTKPPSPSIKPPSPPTPNTRLFERKSADELTIDTEASNKSSRRTSSVEKSAKSPQVSFDVDSRSPQRVKESASESSLLSEGSSSSRGDDQTNAEMCGTLTRRSRPRSSAVSRKMLNAPPPPPPDAKRRSDGAPLSPGPMSPKPGSGSTSPSKAGLPTSPKASGMKPQPSARIKDTADGKSQSPRHLEISGPISVTTTLNSQTLPRPIRKKSSPESDFKTSADDLSQYRKKNKGDSAAKHARNKTVTEGISFEFDTTEEERLNQLLENRNSKFVNRALPPPPTALHTEAHSVPKSGTAKARHSTSDDSNYEFVSMTEGIVERGNYEDIDSVYSAIPGDNNVMSMSLGGASSLEDSDGQLRKYPSDDYLKPVSHSVESPAKANKSKGKSFVDKWTPKAAKRLSDWSEKMLPPTLAESYVMVYANTEVLLDKDRPALSITEGFNKMSVMNIQALQQIADTITRNNSPLNPHFDDSLRFGDFSVGDSLPVIVQGCCCVYRAHSLKVKPQNTFLMLSAKSLHRGFLEQQSCHLVAPSVLLSDKVSAEYFPEPNESSDPDHYQLYGMVQTNMAVLSYTSITNLPTYINELNQRINIRGTNNEEYERQVCYCLSQVFTAILDSYSAGPHSLYAIKTLCLKDIMVVTTEGSDEKFLVVNAASQNHKDDVDYHTLCTDIIQILCFFLNIEYTDNLDSSRIPAKSRYSRGLRQFLAVIGDYSFESLIQGKNILEYLLWGPCLEDHRVLISSGDTVQAFTVWLEVARCKAVTDKASHQVTDSVHTANRFKFLCCVTGMSLQETALLLKI